MAASLPINAFLSTGATFAADLAFVTAATGTHLPDILHIKYSAIATIDSASGSAAELMGLLWSVALIGGLDTYYAWYIMSFG